MGKATGKNGWRLKQSKMSKATGAESSISERPISLGPRRLAEWLNPTGTKKVHSLVDKVYKMKNLELAWERVRQNDGCGGIDKQSIQQFEEKVHANLQKLHEELKMNTYKPQPVLQHKIPKAGQAGKFRKLGIPTVYDRICQQALLNRMEPIFEAVFDESSFGYRKGRGAKDALRKVWKEIQDGNEWIVDADLEDFFGSADHEKVVTLLNQQVSDSRVLGIIKRMLKGGCMTEGGFVPAETGVVQGGVIALRTHSQTLSFSGGWRLKGVSFNYIIKSITFMTNGKIAELGVGQTDQLCVCFVAKQQASAVYSRKVDAEVWSISGAGIPLYSVGPGDQRKNGDTGKFCGVYRKAATYTDQSDKEIIGIQTAIDQQSGSYCAGRIFSKEGSCQKRRNNLRYHLPMIVCGSKNSLRFIISLFRPANLFFSPNNLQMN